jgi:nucleotide-binding universal stress UspA family protein
MASVAPQRAAADLEAMVHYLVDTPEGAVGVLDEWIRDDRGRPTGLVVAQGWFGRRRFEIPLEKLTAVDHACRRVVVASGAAPLGPKGALERLMELGLPRNRADRRAEALAWPAPEAPEECAHWGDARRRPVLCAVADDPHASTVVRTAATLANAMRAPLVLTHVTPADIPPGVSTIPNGQARLREEEERDATQLIDALLSGAAAGANVRRLIARGPTAKTLVDLAAREYASLLVVGSGRKGPVFAALSGSVPSHVAKHAPCPVVLVPPACRVPLLSDEPALITRAG